MQTPAVRLLAATNNARGDLFTRLVKDLFFALGYDELRLDVHKSGRELDVQGTHRLEPRRVVAECKAHKKTMGGTQLNTFFGAVRRERILQRKRASEQPEGQPIEVAAYFVSLEGFTEPGKDQEDESGNEGLILLDGPGVIKELERARVLVGREEAAERAGHCAEHAGLSEAVLDGAELLGHDMDTCGRCARPTANSGPTLR